MVLLAFGITQIQFSSSAAVPGALDLSFGGTGKVKTAFGGGYAHANAAAVQGDGKLVLGGFGNGRYNNNNNFASGGDFLLARFGTNNLLDASFGDGGKVLTQVSTNYPSSQSSVITAVKIQPDGRILASGYSYQKTSYTDFTSARYNPDGSLDTTFGTNGTGIIHTDFGQQSQINAMLLQADSNIVVAGTCGGVALARYRANGVLDSTFGSGGKVITTGTGYAANGLTLQGDGKILVVGTGIASGNSGTEFGVFRYTTNGVLDTTFGTGGVVLTRIAPVSSGYDATANAVAIHPGGITIFAPDKIMVAGTYETDDASGLKYYQALVRYNLDGSLDTTFGNSGIVTNAIVPQSAFGQHCTSLVVQGFGHSPRTYTIGGWGQDANNLYYSLARYTASGAFDTTFGTGSSGKALVSFNSNGGYLEAAANALVLQSGQLVLAGYKGTFESEQDFAAARFTSSGSLDTSFGSNGVLTADLSDAPGAQAKAVAVQQDSKVVAVGVSPPLYFPVGNYSTTRFALVRYNADGSLDSSFGNGGKVLTTISTNDQAVAAAIQSDGKILAAGVGNNIGFVLARYNANGSLDTSFGNNGTASALGGTSGGSPHAIRIQPDGKIVLAGGALDPQSDARFALARFNSNGTLDSAFGSGGSVITSFESPPAEDLSFGVGFQTDGKIVAGGVAASLVSGNVNADFAASRYNTNGGLDFSFGSLGRTTGNVGGGTLDVGYAMVIQADGKILVAGGAGLGGAPGPAGGNQSVNSFLSVIRFNTNGALDTTFGSGGSVITQVGPYSDFATAMVLQPDGKILVAGASQNAYYQYFAFRYNSDGSVDNSFGASGAAVLNFGSGTNEFAYGLALDASGRALLAGDAGGFFGIARLFAYPVAGPILKISLTQTNTAVISWPYPSTGWNLQQNSNLSGGAWTTPPQTVSNDGTNNFIIVNPPIGNAFYRLQGP